MAGYAGHILNGLVAGLISGGVGAAELLTRYRDDPGRLLRTVPAWTYITVNVSAAILAYALLVAFALTLGGDTAGHVALRRVLLAGFAAVAFLRTSLFVGRVDEEDIAYGPSQLVTTLLAIADTQVNRAQAHRRATEVGRIMSGVSFEKSFRALPAYCLASLHGVSDEQQAKLATDVAALAASSMEDAQKTLVLGVKLLELAGAKVLEASVTALGDTIR